MINLSRRSLLGAIICAPAIVRAGSLMPIKVFEHFGPNGYLTAQMIADEAARILHIQMNQSIDMLARNIEQDLFYGTKQVYSGFTHEHAGRKVSIERYSANVIKPAMMQIQKEIKNIAYEPLLLPQGVYEAASGQKGNVSVRFISDYDIMTDSVLGRFDVSGR